MNNLWSYGWGIKISSCHHKISLLCLKFNCFYENCIHLCLVGVDDYLVVLRVKLEFLLYNVAIFYTSFSLPLGTSYMCQDSTSFYEMENSCVRTEASPSHMSKPTTWRQLPVENKNGCGSRDLRQKRCFRMKYCSTIEDTKKTLIQ